MEKVSSMISHYIAVSLILYTPYLKKLIKWFCCYRYGKLLREARKISIKSGLASAFGQGIPFLLTFAITAVTIYFSGTLVSEGKIDPGFVFLVRF